MNLSKPCTAAKTVLPRHKSVSKVQTAAIMPDNFEEPNELKLLAKLARAVRSKCIDPDTELAETKDNTESSAAVNEAVAEAIDDFESVIEAKSYRNAEEQRMNNDTAVPEVPRATGKRKPGPRPRAYFTEQDTDVPLLTWVAQVNTEDDEQLKALIAHLDGGLPAFMEGPREVFLTDFVGKSAAGFILDSVAGVCRLIEGWA